MTNGLRYPDDLVNRYQAQATDPDPLVRRTALAQLARLQRRATPPRTKSGSSSGWCGTFPGVRSTS